MSDEPKATGARRKRRTTEEVLDSIITAASEEFEKNGYTGTKTAAIARRAGVAEALIFTNYGSKANVFHKSIFDPLNEQLVAFCTNQAVDIWPEDGAEFDKRRREYIGDLQSFVRKNARKLTSLVAARLFDEGGQDVGNIDGLYEYFEKAASLSRGNVKTPPIVDLDIMSRVSFATILSCVLFREWLFPEGMATDEQIDDAVINQIISGLRINDP